MAPAAIGGGAIALVLLFVLIGGKAEPKPDLDNAAPSASASAPTAPTTKSTFTMAPAFNQAAQPTPTIAATTNPPQNPAQSQPTQDPLNPMTTPTTTPTTTNATDAAAAPSTSSTIGMPTAIPTPTKESVVAEMNLHIDQVKADIARLESEGKHDQAEQKKKVLERLQGQLDFIQDGGV